MTGRPPQILATDAFLNHDRQPSPGTVDAAALSAAALNRSSALANQSLDVSITSVQHAGPHEYFGPRQGAMTSRHAQFRSQTIAPSPPPPPKPTPQDSTLEETTNQHHPRTGSRNKNSLQIATDIRPGTLVRSDSLSPDQHPGNLQRKASSSSLRPISRTPSFKQAIANSIGSTCSSAILSPVISAMGDVTPLPSPLLATESPGPWKRLGTRVVSGDTSQAGNMPESVIVTANGESVAALLANQAKRKVYAGLKSAEAGETPSGAAAHTRHRSISDYTPEQAIVVKRHVAVSGSHQRPIEPAVEHMRREPNLSTVRGLTPAAQPPTPPPSESSQSIDGTLEPKAAKYEFFEARGRGDRTLRRWRAIRKLGEGTFSRVMLATSQVSVEYDDRGEMVEPDLKTLVAVKVCEHGPRGGASENRIEMSLKRELEIMQSIHHPSLVHLKAWNIEQTRAILVLGYCPGGDLFDVAKLHREALTPPLLRRMFAELVGAVRYLHEQHIVHRDIKLENVLVNMPLEKLVDPHQDWTRYPESVITLTDLGLSRRVADDQKLETRCGSEDYAAPEVILGQPYDGRATDAWSVGVLLYALIESRLPFDPPPGASDAVRMRSRTSHRIARIDWRWIEYAGDDGDHEGNEAKFEEAGLKGAMEITEGLLQRARSRWPLQKVAAHDWVSGGILVESGPKFREEDEGQEVSL